MPSSRVLFLLATAAVLCGPSVARGQATPAGAGSGTTTTSASTQDVDSDTRPADTTRKWEIELHAGIGAAAGSLGGSGTLPSTGAVSQGQLSASTFYFGSGASLFNANLAANGSSASIAPLDSVLLGSAVRRTPQPTIGLRIQRAITRRLAVAGSVDYAFGHLSFEPTATASIEAARSSYITALQRVLASPTLASSVTSVATVTDSEPAQQLKATGALVIDLATDARVTPFLTVGGGMATSSGTLPTASLVGTSQLGNDTQVVWTDTVTLRYTQNSTAVIVLGGGGFKFLLSPRIGLRAEAELQVMRNTWNNVVDAGGTRTLQTGGAPFPSLTFGNTQFSTASPLTGSAIAGSVVRNGSGYERRVVVTTGLYLRF